MLEDWRPAFGSSRTSRFVSRSQRREIRGLSPDSLNSTDGDRDNLLRIRPKDKEAEVFPHWANMRSPLPFAGGAKRPRRNRGHHLTLPANRDLCAARTKYRFS